MSGSDLIGLLGILLGLSLLIWLAFRGWSVLLLAPIAAMVAALLSSEPLLAHWTQTFMRSASVFLAQFFPIFLLGALFGKLMEDSGSVASIADAMTEKLGTKRAILAVVLGGAVVTYGGVSLFVAFFVIAPMAMGLFRAAKIPRRLMPAAIMLGTSTFTMSAMPGAPSIQNTIPMPFFGTTPFAAPGLGLIASAIMLGFGLWWLARAEAAAHARGEGFGDEAELRSAGELAGDETLRERATASHEFDPAEIAHGAVATANPPFWKAAAPIVVVILANLILSLVVLPRLDLSFLAKPEWGSISAVRRHRRVVGAHRPHPGDPDHAGAERAPLAQSARHHGRRRQRLRPAGDQRGEPRRLRRRGRGAARLRHGARRGARHWRGAAGVAGGGDQHPCRAHRLGLGRPDHRPRRARRHLSSARGGHRHGPRPAASRRGDRSRHARQPAAQWRGRDACSPVCGSNHSASYKDIFMVAILGAIVALVAVIVLGSTVGSF